MIMLTRLRGKKVALNADHIETVESTPDTVITMHNGHRYVVEESVDEVIKSVMNYKKEIFCTLTVKRES